MCRLLGITNFELAAHRDILERFVGLARTGNVLPGDPPGHADGWGLGWYQDGKAVVHKSGGSLADEAPEFFRLLAAASGSRVLIAHLRKSAWKDTTSTRHAHPFVLNNVIFAHNGTVRDYRKLVERLKPEERPAPDALDTEVFLHCIARHGADLEQAFRAAVADIRAHNTYSALNSLVTDGERLIAYRDSSAHPDYYSLFRAARGNSAFAASEPLDAQLDWQPLGQGELFSV